MVCFISPKTQHNHTITTHTQVAYNPHASAGRITVTITTIEGVSHVLHHMSLISQISEIGWV